MTPGNTRMARRLVWFAAFINVALLLMLSPMASSGGWLLGLLLMALVDGSIAFYAYRQGLFFEWQQERTWKAVCAGLGGNFVGEVPSIWLSVLAGFKSRGQYHVPTQTKTGYPKLREVYGTLESWTGLIHPFAGQTIDTYTKNSAAFALAFQVPFVAFDIAEHGLIRIRAGHVPVPAAYDHTGQLETRQDTTNLPLLPLGLPMVSTVSAHTQTIPALAYARELLRNVPMARDLNGCTWYMPIEGQHVLVAGRTGSGKGSWIWSLVLGLEPAIAAGLCRIWALDPKRVELSLGRHRFYKYAHGIEDMVKLIEEFLAEMQVRGDAMQGVVRKFTSSKETPLNILLIDELAYITSLLPDKKLKERAMGALTTILTQGRALGYSVFGAIQDPRKETLPNRDSWPIRIALGLAEKQLVDMLLGDGAHENGALAELIPMGPAGAGVGYVVDETSLKPLCLRAAWVGDEAIQQVMAELAPPAHNLGNAIADDWLNSQLDLGNRPF